MTRTYEELVAPGDFGFRSRGNTDRLHDVVKFNWEMAPRDGGEIAGVGLEMLNEGVGDRFVTNSLDTSRPHSARRGMTCCKSIPAWRLGVRRSGSLPA